MLATAVCGTVASVIAVLPLFAARPAQTAPVKITSLAKFPPSATSVSVAPVVNTAASTNSGYVGVRLLV